MTRYLLDTNHVSAIFKRQPEILARIRPSPQAEFSIPLPAVGELWFMVFNSARVAQNAADVERVLAAFTHYPYDDGAAREFGRLKADMRRAGRTIPDVDVQIAAVARVNSAILLSADAHFQFVPGLMTENWLA
jgi:tRNA(fMet)-specific endonuclease VapC